MKKTIPKTVNVSFIPFFVFGFFLSLLATKLRKYHLVFVYILQGKMDKTEKTERKSHNYSDQNTKNQKTKVSDEWNKSHKSHTFIFNLVIDTLLHPFRILI